MIRTNKILRQEKVIQVFGVLMLLSPFVNLYLSILPVKSANKWTWPVLKVLLSEVSTVHWVLWGCSLIIGFLMLKGRRSSWISVLVLLSIFIFYDLFTFKQQIQNGWVMPVLMLMCNVFIFSLVYSLEFQSNKTKKTLLWDLRHMKNFTLDFEGYGKWAKITEIHGRELILTTLLEPPYGVETERLEIERANCIVYIKFKELRGNKLVFQCDDIQQVAS